MKHCPECSAQYEESIKFCPKDGRSLVSTSATAARLCPHCANSIANDAAQCPYCRKDLTVAPEKTPSSEWLIRDEAPQEIKVAPPPGERSRAPSRMPKIVLITGIVLCVLGAAMLGMGILGSNGDGEVPQLSDEKMRELQVREEHFKAVEAQLAKVQEEASIHAKQAAENAKEVEAIKARLQESQKELAVTNQRLSVVNRELERVSARRAPVAPRVQPRPVERASAPSRPARRPAAPGVYETVRTTPVHEQPEGSSRVLSRIGRGTRINVVRSHGDWLEVISRHGNPPGFIRWDDAMFVRASS